MGVATVIPKNTFDTLQLDAGTLLKEFDPTAPAFKDEAMIGATTGGISVSCVPTYEDLGEDVDNCPVNMLELKKLTGWECKMSFSNLRTDPEAVRLALGAADIAGNKITPRRNLDKSKDFHDIWWVGDLADGGLAVVCLKNALSTGGFSLQTTKGGKGQVAMELTGHVSIDAQDVMPMEFYFIEPTPAQPANEGV